MVRNLQEFSANYWNDAYWSDVFDILSESTELAVFDGLYKEALSELSELISSIDIVLDGIQQYLARLAKIDNDLRASTSITSQVQYTNYFESDHQMLYDMIGQIADRRKRQWKNAKIFEKHLEHFQEWYADIEDIEFNGER